MRSIDRLIKIITSEEYGYSMTDNINEAIYLLPDGQMISGDFYYGSRNTDHRMIEAAYTNKDRYTEGFWDSVHKDYRVVRLVPESRYALVRMRQRLTHIQESILNETDYIIERY